jgi:hypothetical protein
MPDKSIREFVRERMHEGNGGRLHLHRLFDATRKAYPRKVVPFSYVRRSATEWFRDGGHLLKEHAGRSDADEHWHDTPSVCRLASSKAHRCAWA